MGRSRKQAARGKTTPPARLLYHEMRTIAALQQCLLPRQIPQPDGWQIAAYYDSGEWPGGDYYDFLPQPDGSLAFLVADCSGHGGAAAVMVAQVRTLLHACPLLCGQDRQPFCPLLNSTAEPPPVVLAHLDRILGENSLEDEFMTVFYGVLNPASGTVRYANAGHPLPRCWRAATRTLEPLPDSAGWPIGIGLGSQYLQEESLLEPGDLLICVSDGLIQARNDKNKFFGFDRLDSAIRKAAPGGAEATKMEVQTSLGQFMAGKPFYDDVTLLVIGRQP
jgi:sigma-B regulation protein RsbU (phosphoserine phosphatase)